MSKPVSNYQPPQLDANQRDLQPILISLFNWALTVVFRLNNALMKDGSEGMTGPLLLKSYATADLPTPSAALEGAIVWDTTTNTVKRCNGAAWANVP